MRLTAWLAVAVFLGLAGTAQAVVYVEGETVVSINGSLATASDLSGLAPTITVLGTFFDSLLGPGVDDLDFYRIHATAGSTLSMSVVGPTTGSISANGGTTDVALFDSAGLLLAFSSNDYSLGPTSPAGISPYSISTTGFYYVAISEWSEWPAAAFSATFTPLAGAGYGVSGVAPNATYADSGGLQHPGEPYELVISGTSAVPEPGVFGLVLLSLAGVGALRRPGRP